MQNEEVVRALNYSYFYLKFRPRSKSEIEKYLYKKSQKFKWALDTVTLALVDLEQQNLINDKEFVVWFVEQRNAHKPKSAYVLKNELLKYGIDRQIIDEYFSQHEQNEDELALQALKRKWSRFSRLEDKERFEKATNFLSRRGFSFDIIKKTIAQIEEKE